jgi:branched-chain amino acid transport system permease protein
MSEMSRLRRLSRFFPALALVALTLLLAFTLQPAELVILKNIIVLALFAVATNFLLGTAGIVSLGQACFYGLGTYVIAMAWFHGWADFWLAAIAAPLIGAAVAFLLGALALRSQRWFLALLTMAFSQLFFTIAQKAHSYTQGDTGIFGPMVPDAIADPRGGALFIFAVAALAMATLWWITVSPLGLTLQAIRENQRRAQGLGIDVYRTQLLAFTISGGFCALAGVLNAVNQQGAHPGLLDWVQSGDPILVSVIGGLYTFLGPVIGAIVYQLGHDAIVRITLRWQLFFGIILLVVVLCFPDGLAGLFRWSSWTQAYGRLKSVTRRPAAIPAPPEPRS